jgi:hypothetical protein
MKKPMESQQIINEIVQEFLDSHNGETRTSEEWRILAANEGLYEEDIDELITYLDGRQTIKKGWMEPTNLLVIDYQRYWLTDVEMERVRQIQNTSPNTWEKEVLKRMSTLSL